MRSFADFGPDTVSKDFYENLRKTVAGMTYALSDLVGRKSKC